MMMRLHCLLILACILKKNTNENIEHGCVIWLKEKEKKKIFFSGKSQAIY